MLAPVSANLTGLALPADVDAAEAAMLEQPQVDCPVIHRFGPGIYIREVKIPAGTIAIGHRQKTEHMNVFLQGRVTVFNDNGTTSELVAPMIFVGQPGRKVGYIHEDMVWLNIYSTDETDIERLEAAYLEKSITWQEHQAISSQIRLLPRAEDQADYLRALAEFGIPHTIARQQSEDEADQIPFPYGGYKCKVATSAIEGNGLFATASIEPGEVIAPARIGGKRTPAGRYTNHSATPNAQMVQRDSGDIDLVATAPIKGCVGGQDGDEITIDYRQALGLQIERKAP